LIFIDTNGAYYSYSPGSAQYTWLENELSSIETQSATWRFAFHHHPPYSEGWDSPGYDGEPDVRDYIVPLYETYDLTACFAGHTHDYERGIRNDVLYFITGGGGAPLDTWQQNWDFITVYYDDYQYMVIDVSGEALHITSHDTTGALVDSLTIAPLGIAQEYEKSMPADIVADVSPNPANTTVHFSGRLSIAGTIAIYDIDGRMVHERRLPAGALDFSWTPDAPSGMYFYRISVSGMAKEGKFAVVK